MIWHMPLERYEERYTEQWWRWFNRAFQNEGVHYTNVEGKQITTTIEEGSVLDVYGTNYYKMTQLANLIEHIQAGHVKDEDTVFFADLWFPGIEALQYIRNVTDKKFRITGVLHAGTWDRADFTYRTGMEPWGKHIEQGWLKFFDEIYVGSLFHKDIIMKYNDIDGDKIVVTGLPFEAKEVDRTTTKENIVVFPHRLDPEKRPDLFEQLKPVEGWKFVKTKDVTSSKEEYYQLLGKSKIAVSFAEQETFGYAMLEALANGCYPIVVDGLSYATMEIYKDFRVKDIHGANQKVDWVIANPETALQQIQDAQALLKQYETENFVKQIK